MKPPNSLVSMTMQDRDITLTVLRERSRLGNFIRRRIRDPTEADDILQHVFYEFVEAYRLAAPIEQVSAWYLRVARDRIVDRLRKKREQSSSESQDPDGIDGEYQPDLMLPATDAGPEAAYARSVLLNELQRAFDELPESQHDVFIGHEFDGLSFKEIAAQRGVAVNTLLARKRHAVLYLRARVQEIYDEFHM